MILRIQLQNTAFYPVIGGIETYLYYVAKGLIKSGCEPLVLCSQTDQHLPVQDIYDGVKIVRHSRKSHLYPIPLYNYFRSLQKWIEESCKDVDAIWTRHPYYCFASCKADLGLPIIYIQATAFPLLHKYARSESGLVQKTYHAIRDWADYHIEKYAMENCDRIVVLSKIRRKEIADFYHFAEDEIKVIPPGVDLERFKPRKKDVDLLKELEIPENAQVVLGVGRVRSEKNFLMLLKAFAILNSKPNVYLVIVGDGPQRLELQEKSKQLSIEEKTRFAGYRKDVERFYSIADVFVLPSKYEGFGHVYLEAMASGVPCIGLRSNYPEIIVATEEIIKECITGFSVDPYSVDALAEKIQKTISNHGLRHTLGAEARKVCEETYSWERTVNNLLQETRLNE